MRVEDAIPALGMDILDDPLEGDDYRQYASPGALQRPGIVPTRRPTRVVKMATYLW